MARKTEEQQPLTANGSESSARTAQAEVTSYGAAPAAAAAARPSDAASDAAAAAAVAEDGASNGFGDVYGEEEEVEAGRRGLLGATNGAAAGSSGRGTGKDGATTKAVPYTGERHNTQQHNFPPEQKEIACELALCKHKAPTAVCSL